MFDYDDIQTTHVEVVAVPLAPVTLEVADRWPDGTIDTFPHENGVGAILSPDGTGTAYVNDEDGSTLTSAAATWTDL
jgi:hypothetical protein